MMRKLVFITTLILSITTNAHTASEQTTENYFATIKNNPKQLDIFLKTMPKGGDLHNHLGGASLAENMIGYAKNDPLCINKKTLAVQEQIDCYPVYRLKNLAHYPNLYNATIDAWSMRNFHASKESGHDHFFASFKKYSPIIVRHRGEMISEVVKTACEKNSFYLELMITPDNNASGLLGKQIGWNPNLNLLRKKLLSHGLHPIVCKMSKRLDNYQTTLQQSLKDSIKSKTANSCHDFKLRYLYQVLREQPPEQVFAQLLAGFELASNDSRVLGINIVEPEDGKIARRDYTLHMQMIAFLHRLYPKVHISLHAGELNADLVPVNDLSFHIHQAVEIAQATRIGHGVDIQQETNSVALLKKMAKKHILVEINLSSNEAILGIKGKQHPILLYMHYKVPVALSTDDEGVLRTNLTEQYKKAILNYGFSYFTIKNLVRNSINYSFLPGKTLWNDDQYHQLVPVCQASFAADFISIPCQHFLNANEKAYLQWQLENQFLTFEKQYQ
jgi:adenosine deaminase